ncbi:MAG: anti-sigma F factor antagonist [Candidatus Carbobacillus altaicus]|nr:anti-sigma F factor antagonist [Candidatus Carbobacillus altaicus]
MALSIMSERHGQVMVSRLVGEFDQQSAALVRDTLEQAILVESIDHLVLNLSGLTFMDSTGIGVLLGRYKQITQRGGRIVVCGLSPTIARLFELSGLSKIMIIAPSEEDALQVLGVA